MTTRPPRRRVRRLVLWGGLAALVILILLYARCRGGLGLGGGTSSGALRGSAATATALDAAPAAASAADAGTDAAPPRCQVRVDAQGVTLDGKPATVDAAIAACRTAGAADVLVTGDAVQGTWDQLRTGLEAAGVKTFVRGAPTPATDAGPP